MAAVPVRSVVAASEPRRSASLNTQVELDDHYLIALAKQGRKDAYDRIVKRYYGFVRLKASSYFLIGGDSDDLIQEGLVGLYKAVRDYRSDRESSFRNFAELCITRQIITAVKTSTRNKHTPLNEYVSFSQTPAAGGGDGDPTLDELLPGPDRARSREPGDLLRGAAQPGGLPVERAVGARELGAVALPRRTQLRGDRRAARMRHEDGRQRPPAREAQGRRASDLAQGAALGRASRTAVQRGPVAARAGPMRTRPAGPACPHPAALRRRAARGAFAASPRHAPWRDPRRRSRRAAAGRRPLAAVVRAPEPRRRRPPRRTGRARTGWPSCAAGRAAARRPGGPRRRTRRARHRVRLRARAERGARSAAPGSAWSPASARTAGWPGSTRRNRALRLRRTRCSLHADLSGRWLELRRGGRTVRRITVAIGRPGSETPDRALRRDRQARAARATAPTTAAASSR